MPFSASHSTSSSLKIPQSLNDLKGVSGPERETDPPLGGTVLYLSLVGKMVLVRLRSPQVTLFTGSP